MNSLIKECELQALAREKQLPCLKICIREAARRVRAELATRQDVSLQSMRMALASISRAICFNNVALASRLCKSSQLASDLLNIMGRAVECSDHTRFDEIFNYAQREVPH